MLYVLKMYYWSPKNVELLNVMNKINHQILCILLDYGYTDTLLQQSLEGVMLNYTVLSTRRPEEQR